jgi:hypothetical protein
MKQSHYVRCVYRPIQPFKKTSALDLEYSGMQACDPAGRLLKTFRQEPENAELDRDNADEYLRGWTAGVRMDHTVADYILLKKTDPGKRSALIVQNKILLPPFEN